MSADQLKASFDHLRDNLHHAIDRWTGRNDVAEHNSNDVWPDTFRGASGPAVEVTEDDLHVHVNVELPGMKREDFSVDLSGRRLVIRGEKKSAREEKQGETHFSEVNYGSFYRSVQLPAEVDAESAQAVYKDGVLRLTMTKTETAKSRRVNVS